MACARRYQLFISKTGAKESLIGEHRDKIEKGELVEYERVEVVEESGKVPDAEGQYYQIFLMLKVK